VQSQADEPAEEPPKATPQANPYSFSFTDDDLKRFWADKWKLTACEVCTSREQWSLGGIEKYSVIPTTEGINNAILSLKITVHLRVHCQSCGNTKFFLAPVIANWLKEHP
jgi:hypothetical protein